MRKIAPANSKEISPEKLKELKQNASGILADCRRNMIYRFPFIGSIAMNLDMVPTRDLRNPTAATDGQAIYFDIDFLSELTNDQRIFVIAHEVWHNVMLHLVRREKRNHMLFNVATDLEVNQILVKDGLSIPDGCLLPANMGVPSDLSAEEYYNILLKKNNSSSNSKSDRPSKSGNSKGGSFGGKADSQFDKHVYEGDDVNESESKDECIADKYGKVGLDEDFRPSVTKSNVEHVREAAVAAAETIMRQRGELPGHIANIVNKLIEPEILWKDVLCQFVTRNSGGDKRTWSRPNRRFAWHGTYLQGSETERLRVAVGLDTSGSTSQDMQKFLSEVNGLVKSFGYYDLHIIQCDTHVAKYDKYDESMPLDLEHTEFEVAGGGGTCLMPIFDYVKDNDLDVDVIVIFTDGYTEKFEAKDAPEIPVLWVLTKDGDKGNIGFGEIATFKS